MAHLTRRYDARACSEHIRFGRRSRLEMPSLRQEACAQRELSWCRRYQAAARVEAQPDLAKSCSHDALVISA